MARGRPVAPPTPRPAAIDDPARLVALRSTRLLDTAPEEAFDRLTRLGARMLRAPVVLINLVEADRQFAKSRVGPSELPSEGPAGAPAAVQPPVTSAFHSFCRHVVTSGAPLAVHDAREHPLVLEGVVVPGRGVVAYAGVPLVTSDGNVLGSFCAIDSRPRDWSDVDVGVLRDLAAAVMTEVELRAEVARRQRIEEEARQGEAYLRTAHERLEALVRLSPLAIISLTPDFIVTGWNPAAERIFGWLADEVLGKPYPLASSDQRKEVERLRQATFDEGGVDGVELRRWRRDGSPVDLYLSTAVVRDGTGNVSGTIGFYMDITERKLLEERLRHSQKMEAVGQLAGGIAHDFNNLLTIITGHSDLLLGSLAGADVRRSDVEAIRHAAVRAAALVRQLLAFGRKQMLSPRVLCLGSVVTGLAPMLRRLIGDDIHVIVTSADDLWPVLADQGQLEQVIVNLAVNARDAMPTGGTLTLSTANITIEPHAPEPHDGVTPGHYVVLAVSDTGIGMSDDTRQRAFEPFFTTKPVGQGTGLGLATVYGIVTQSGGDVRCVSAPGRGTTVRVYLRRAERPPVITPTDNPIPDAAAAAPVATPRGGETILVVEDDPGVRRLTTRALASLGYHVLEAADGASALELAREHLGRLDLVLTDAVMPGMGGTDLARALAELRPATRYVFMSGYTDDEILRRGTLDTGAAFIQKPFTPEGLARVVRRVLDGPMTNASGLPPAPTPARR